MNLEEKLNNLEKLERKRKWLDASKTAVELANYYSEIEKDYPQALKFLERSISSQQQEKKTENVIILYRKIITTARKGKNKTSKELFRYAAAAIPLIEEYIQVLNENQKYISKHGAMTRYFLGECREIVSGVQERNREFVLAGRVFIEVGKKLSELKNKESETEEVFEKSRAIFDLTKTNNNDIFDSFLIEAEINIKKFRFERGFYLFDEARAFFDDEKHISEVANLEKEVYAEIGLIILEKEFDNLEQRNLAETLISKSKEAHIYTKTIDEFSKVLLNVAKIFISNNLLDKAKEYFDEAINNSQLIGDETIPRQIIDFLFQEVKTHTKWVESSSTKLTFSKIESLPFIKYLNMLIDICRKLDRGQEAEDIAIYIWQIGQKLLENEQIDDDFPYIEKAMGILISHSRYNGIHKIGEILESRIEQLASKRKIDEFMKLKDFLINTYEDIGENISIGWLNVKIAKYYSSWGDHENQILLLKEALFQFQNTDQETLRNFCKNLLEQYEGVELSIYQDEFIDIIGNTYLILKDEDKYDSLYASQALHYLEIENFEKAKELHKQDFEFLKRVKNISRAIKRAEEFSIQLLNKKKMSDVINIRSNLVKLLIDTSADQNLVLQTIKRTEEIINNFIIPPIELKLLNALYNHIITMYDYLELTEAKGDISYEIALRLLENNIANLDILEDALNYLSEAYRFFSSIAIFEKCGIILDLITEKKDYFKFHKNIEVSDKFMEFLIEKVMELGQLKEAAELILDRAIQIIVSNEEKAMKEFIEAKKVISQIGSQNDKFRFSHEFGSALLKSGKIEKGLIILSQANEKSETGSLAIADTCLSVAKDKFIENDLDSYFVLIDKALSIYTELGMINESSSIALSEARKLWSIGNIAYTFIFLERAWASLSLIYDEELLKKIDPILQVTEEIIKELFNQNKYDDVTGFIEFQERIYKHLNWTKKIIKIEKKKIEALIGKGQFDIALAKVYDTVNVGIEESNYIETIELIQSLLTTFIIKKPTESDFLLEKLVELYIEKIEEKNYNNIFEIINDCLDLIINSLSTHKTELFKDQIVLFIRVFSKSTETEPFLVHFLLNMFKKSSETNNCQLLVYTLMDNLSNLVKLKSILKLNIIQELKEFLVTNVSNQETIYQGLSFIDAMSINMNTKECDTLVNILFEIASHYKNQSDIYDIAIKLATEKSKRSNDPLISLNLLNKLIHEDIRMSNYLNAMRKIDEVAEVLNKLDSPENATRDFILLIDDILIDLAKLKKKDWMDLLTTKRMIIKKRFLGEGTEVMASEADNHLSESLVKEMLDLTSKKGKKKGK